MSGFRGADDAQLRELAALFGSRSSTLRTLEAQLTGRINGSRWDGPDAARFIGEWNTGHRKAIAAAVTLFDRMAQDLRTNADQQDRASAADPADAGGAAGGPGPTGIDAHRRDLRSQLAAMGSASAPEVRQWWNSLSDADRAYLLQGKDPHSGLPLANALLALQDRLPPGAVEQARQARFEIAKGEIPVYDEKTALTLDGRVAWVHGGAHLTSDLKVKADGTVDLKLSGDLGGGVNAPGGVAGATLTGEISRTYHFASLADALAARDQMLRDVPPDELGEVHDLVDDPAKYLSDKLNAAAGAHGATGHDDKWKGTFALEAQTPAGGPSKNEASGKLAMSYEQNVTDGSSVAEAAVSGKAKLDLGDGASFAGAAEAKFKLEMDPQHQIERVTLEADGTFLGMHKLPFGGAGAGAGAPVAIDAGPAPASSSGSMSAGAGVHGSVRISVDNTPQNAAVIQDYVNHLTAGDQSAADQDLGRLYRAGEVVLQVDNAASTEVKAVDVNTPAFALKAGMKTEIEQNVATLYKAPNDLSYQLYTPATAGGVR